MKHKIQLDATYYFIILMLGSTCFGHGLWLPHRLSGSRVAAGWKLSSGRIDEFPDRRTEDLWSGLRPGNSSILHALNFHPAATREPGGLCGNQRYRRELLMMGIMVPETC